MTELSIKGVNKAPSAGTTEDTCTLAPGQTQPRRKRFAPRTRTGCLTCRVRRIKCDEARPACQRCIRAWRPCGGYHLPPPLTTADAQLQPAPVAPASAAELALSRYYAAEIGAIAVDEFSGRGARELPPILGGGAAHPPANDDVVGRRRLVLASYAVSVGERAVFASIVAASRRLVRQWVFWECLDVPSVAAAAAQILYVYVKAERVAEEFHLEVSSSQAAARPPGRWLDALAALQRRPLTSTLRACLELDMVWNSVHDVLDALPPMPTAGDAAAAHAARQPFAPLFAAWEARYDAYVTRLRGVRRGAEVDIAALDLRRALVSILLRVPVGSPSETCWDPFARDFAAAVAGLEAALPAATAAAAATGLVLSTPSIYASCNFEVSRARSSAAGGGGAAQPARRRARSQDFGR
ncbi:Zn(2)-C6 fungal-type DNA-binding domain protein [Cordyceps fumosorosea ARSEF 2679]|uniref:Zn(2)-C6 fungal-type DNA-binding domain protein n=1 Tax=Cordyceps fumosorosea (strain ARSEF 2679) TaxID=1081104 RepID=A0A168DYF5_CORFA|nr:Zn(2)-C6 fungal-type DNA-binding domain protein [Cordyceps fumosorosea ARSEF 2679]OAA73155.1 Zn(2)-C6 fungal-type DNA-binding domain protein [Cordyceps fumosorosea ARSEF 2679]